MKTEEWKKVNEIVLDALELDETYRSEFIRGKCLNSPEICREVESLLAGETEAEEFFGEAALNYAGFLAIEDNPEALAGQEIGNYRIIREIGRGGMGSVYLAERADGKFEQRVALKLLRRELNTINLRRRFRHERQILAALQHPNIAHLLDAGATDDGIPFLAMEYIEGLPIDVFCDKQNYDLTQRLKLFRAVCEAVAYAHRNLVVHRDLKPSNIIVTDDGTPKLLDFGIAKLLTPEFEAESEHTITKLGAMTPNYASPEQLKMETVSTTSDVYSLGVILYELLSGRRPFESYEMNIQKVLQAVCEIEPPPPSLAIVPDSYDTDRKATDATTIKLDENSFPAAIEKRNDEKTVAQKLRQTSPHFVFSNPQMLRGDLDNIVLKALKKEPDRRYSSVEFLSEDIRRHLEGLPVTACPDTFVYRAEKFFKRNRTVVLAGVLILIAIVGGLIATFWQARVAAAERDHARLEAEKSKKINAYLQNILNFSNPHWLSSNPARNRNAKVSDAMDEALKKIDTDLANEPEIQAEILFTLGKTYVGQGQYDKAENLLREAMEKFDRVFGGENIRSMQTSVILGDTLYLKGKLDEAEKFYIQAINYFRPISKEDNSQIKWLAIALTDLGNIYALKGKYDEAEAVDREGLELAKKVTGDDRFMLPIAISNLAVVIQIKGDLPGALNYYNQALAVLREMGNEQHFEAGTTQLFIGKAYSEMEDYEKAENSFQEAYRILVNTVGEEDVYTSLAMMNIANNSYQQGKYQEAKIMIDKALQIQHKIFPNGHFTIAYSQRVLGNIYTKTNELKKGEMEIRSALEVVLKTAKEPSNDISLIKTSLGENLIAQKRFEEAREALQSALDGFIKIKGEDNHYTKGCRELLIKIPNN